LFFSADSVHPHAHPQAVCDLLSKSRAMVAHAPDQQVADALASSVNRTAEDVLRLLEGTDAMGLRLGWFCC
jgi:hypothetical protein